MKTKNLKFTTYKLTNTLKKLTGIICVLFFTNSFKVFSQASVANSTNTVASGSFLGSGATSNFDVTFKRNNIFAGLLATTSTSFGVNSKAVANSTSIGVGAGQFSSGTGFNTYIGQNAGKGLSASVLNTGRDNTFIGSETGIKNTTGFTNTFIGSGTGSNNTTGTENIFIGSGAGYLNTTGGNNLYIGKNSGSNNPTGTDNVFIGNRAGQVTLNSNRNVFIGNNTGDFTDGSDNVFIGNSCGQEMLTNNKLIIGNTRGSELIWGDFALNQLKLNAKVGIGVVTTFPTTSGAVNNVANYNLFVKGGILTEEIRVSLATTWADYVFSKDYKMPTLPELEKQIQEKGHLPNMPSAQEVKENGIELGEMAKMQQEKIEELTLYIIQMNKELQELKAKIKN